MARASKPRVPTVAKPGARSTVRRSRRAPAASAAPEMTKTAEWSAAAPLPEAEPAAVEPAVTEAPVTETPAVAAPVDEPVSEALPVETPIDPPAEIPAAGAVEAQVEDGAPAPQEAAAAATPLAEAAPSEPAAEPRSMVARGRKPAAAERTPPAGATSLPGITFGFWQEQLERAMTTGQAILVCRSPEEAVRLQLSYMQATLVSGFERVGLMTRWSQERVREVLPSRPR
jgi:hypothetical protein